MSKNRLSSVLLVSILLLVAVLGISACVDITPEPVVYVITFDSNGGSAVETLCVGDGLTVAKPADPTKEGYEFIGWYIGETKYDFDTSVTEDITLVAHWQAKAPAVTHTVTFNSDGGSAVASQTVEDGKTAQKPQDPAREGYDFIAWYLGALKYDFNTPVTKDIELTAEWDEKQYTVTFDSNGGSAIADRTVSYNSAVTRPDNPTREGFYFEGWFVNDVKYDFAAPIKGNLTVTAKWSGAEQVDNAFLAALAADYSNYTSEVVFADSEASYMHTYKRASTYAYRFTVNDWDDKGPHDDHFVIFDSKGAALAMYRLNESDQWVRSTVSHVEFVLALNWQYVSLEDVYYSEGVYYVYPESVNAIVYALFLRNDVVYDDLAFTVKDGRIATLVAHIGETEQIQMFTDFGETEIEMPAIPAVTVSIEKSNRELEAGRAIDVDELIKLMFQVKAEDKDYTLTREMLSFGELNLENPAVGDYTVTLSFKTWDGATHTSTVTVSVKATQDETFADIFAKNYGNVTITMVTSSDTTVYKHVGNVYTSSKVPNAYYFAESDNSLTKYVVKDGNCTPTANNWFVLLRTELLFALNSELFEQVGDTNVYVAKNKADIAGVLEKTFVLKTYKLNEQRDYSITLTVELGRVTKVAFSYYYLPNQSTVGTTSNGTLRTLEYVLSDFGATVIDIPEEVQALRNPAATEQTAYIEDKKYVA